MLKRNINTEALYINSDTLLHYCTSLATLIYT